MTEEKKEGRKLEVHVKYGELEAKFTGAPDEVYRGIIGFLSKALPTYEVASGLTLTVGLTELVEGLRGIIADTPEGMVLLIPRDKLTDRDAIILHLAKTYLSYHLGKGDKPSLSSAQIVDLTGTRPGGAAARLSELADIGWVARVGKGEYQITTLGLRSLLDVIVPRLRTLAGER